MILLIDNYDSFTYNLVQCIQVAGYSVTVKLNDQITIGDIVSLAPKKIVLSPGPGKPENAGICNEAVKYFYNKLPILGVCLGMQCIGQVFGSTIIHAKKPLHGKTSPVYHNNTDIYIRCSNPLVAGRYHSLALRTVPNEFNLTAWDPEKEIMGIAHKELPVFGVQFHPESFLTPEGQSILEAFLEY